MRKGTHFVKRKLTEEQRARVKIYMNRPEVKKRLSEQKIGDKNPMKKPEVAKKFSEARKGKGLGERNGNWNGGMRIKDQCLKCNKEVIRWKSQKLSKLFCSHKCYGEWSIAENASGWMGGISFEPYPIIFNKRFKESIRKRDRFTCIKCGMKEQDSLVIFGGLLCVHHVDYIKENTFSENCCTLCNRCNGEVNINRSYWTEFFRSLLNERYDYKYNKNEEIYN